MKNERRQSVDNQPYGRAVEILSQAAYPASHPYSWDVIGSMADLSAASEDDVKSFFKLYYAPNNAILTIVGDFEAAQVKAWVTRSTSATLPRGNAIVRPSVSPVTLDKETRLVYEDRVPQPRLYILWPTVGEKSDDRFALQVLDAITAGPRTTRLTKALVYDQQARHERRHEPEHQRRRRRLLASSISPQARARHSPNSRRPPTPSSRSSKWKDRPLEEIQRATAGLEAGFLAGLQIEPRQVVHARRRLRVPPGRRPVQDGLSEVAGGDAR